MHKIFRKTIDVSKFYNNFYLATEWNQQSILLNKVKKLFIDFFRQVLEEILTS